MIRVGVSKAVVFELELLEDRCLLAAWPVPVAGISGIAATYGQFDNRGDRIHFHEGIDIIVAKDTEVRAINDGTVVGVTADQGYFNHVSIATNASSGWNYLHLQPSVTKGANVKAGDVIGTVLEAPSPLPTHLHLDAAGDTDPTDQTGAWLRPIDDPLVRLDTLGDTTAPTMGDVHFLRGEEDSTSPHALAGGTAIGGGHFINQTEERGKTHGYFKTLDFSTAVVVGHRAGAKTANGDEVPGTSNIDIIANATDKIKSADPWVGIRSIEFKATGQQVGKTIAVVRPYNFAGQFVWDPTRLPLQQNYDSLRISNLTRVAYENDHTSPSNAQPPDPLSYFHILTNTDAANYVIDSADRNRYWRSKVTEGRAWNDISAGASEAVNNAKGAYPDDYYEIKVTAKDAAANSSDKTQHVVLDNWLQTCPAAIEEKIDEFNYRVAVTGYEFTANSTVKLYMVPGDLPDGCKISDYATFLTTAATDENGTIIPLSVTVSTAASFRILADYHGGNNRYESRLDGLSAVLEYEEEGGEEGAGFMAPPSWVSGFGLLSSITVSSGPTRLVSPTRPRLPSSDALPVLNGTPITTESVEAVASYWTLPVRPVNPLALPGDLFS